jgi:hypothetical protein
MTKQTKKIVSIPNHPDPAELTVVSVSAGLFGYLCNSCGGYLYTFRTRKAAEGGALNHECPQVGTTR